MLDTKHIFNLTKLGKKEEYLQAIMNTSSVNRSHPPLGCPLIVSKKDFDNEKAKSIKGLFPFPFKLGQKTGSSYSVDKSHLIVKNDECFTNNSKIKVIPEFKMDNFNTLLEHVKDNGSIIFNISALEKVDGALIPNREKETATSVCKFLDALYNMGNKYKYNSLFYTNYSEDFITSDVSDIYYTASFLDLYNCIPIFNYKKVDGVGIMFNMSLIRSTKTAGSLISKACIALVLSNHKDNIFITDGVQVNEVRPISTGLIKVIKNIVMANVNSRNKSKIKEEKKESTDGWVDVVMNYGGATTDASNSEIKTNDTSYFYYT